MSAVFSLYFILPLKTCVTIFFFVSRVCKCILTFVHTSRYCHVMCACVALTIFHMTTYQFNMLHSPLDSVLALHRSMSLHSRWFQRRACSTTCHASTPPCYRLSSSSSHLLEPSSSRGEEMHKQKQHH